MTMQDVGRELAKVLSTPERAARVLVQRALEILGQALPPGEVLNRIDGLQDLLTQHRDAYAWATRLYESTAQQANTDRTTLQEELSRVRADVRRVQEACASALVSLEADHPEQASAQLREVVDVQQASAQHREVRDAAG